MQQNPIRTVGQGRLGFGFVKGAGFQGLINAAVPVDGLGGMTGPYSIANSILGFQTLPKDLSPRCRPGPGFVRHRPVVWFVGRRRMTGLRKPLVKGFGHLFQTQPFASIADQGFDFHFILKPLQHPFHAWAGYAVALVQNNLHRQTQFLNLTDKKHASVEIGRIHNDDNQGGQALTGCLYQGLAGHPFVLRLRVKAVRAG